MECSAFRVAQLNPGAEPVAEIVERLRRRRRHVDRLTEDEVDAIAVVLEDQPKGPWVCHQRFFSRLDNPAPRYQR